ncbi:MAG: hypothetical protein HOP08_08720 [Cyclobacteriaceae bacterium]|nr:hypothetical protein [Cyclobacteriaceae bacterium]
MAIPCVGFAQTYSFPYLRPSDNFAIDNDDNGVYCLYRSSKTKTSTTFLKVLLDQNLRAIDSVEYVLDGNAELLTSGGNERFTFHAFESKSEGVRFIEFLITSKSGKLQYSFRKGAVDIERMFGKHTRVQDVRLEFLSDPDNNILLVKFNEFRSRDPIMIVAFDMQNGSQLWKSTRGNFNIIQTTDSLVIALRRFPLGSESSYSINYFGKQSGVLIKSMPYNSAGVRPRVITVMATNGQQLMLVGEEYIKEAYGKESHFFMTMFDMNGQQIFDKVDTADRMGKHRRHLSGSVFDAQGNLVLVGEGYRLDATRMVVSGLATIALAVATGANTYGYGGLGGPDDRVDFITSAIISPEDGEVKQHWNFPVGPWIGFPSFLTDGKRILIGISNNFLLYKVDAPDVPPVKFVSLKTREQLVLTSYGPAISYRHSTLKMHTLELLKPLPEPVKKE